MADIDNMIATLYVEKYDKRSQELMLEFVHEKEFWHFVNRGENIQERNYWRAEYRPTMIMAYKCAPKSLKKEDVILEIQMNALIQYAYEKQNVDFEDLEDAPVTVFGVVRSGKEFAELIDNPEICTIRSKSTSDWIPTDFFSSNFGSSHFENPIYDPFFMSAIQSGLGGSGDDCITLDVWDVGEGNSNRLTNGNDVILYDFGSYMHNSKNRVLQIFNKYQPLYGNNPAIIISHWDKDHYNQLCVAPLAFLSQVRCIAFPAIAMGVTVKQLLLRIKACTCCISIGIGQQKYIAANTIVDIAHIGPLTLYMGGKSTDKNKSGLLIRARGISSHAFLTGDNTVWSQLLLDSELSKRDYVHVVVPHHGSKSVKLTSVNFGVKPGTAVISVGPNHYNPPHPIIQTMNDYNQEGYTIERTDLNGDISISL